MYIYTPIYCFTIYYRDKLSRSISTYVSISVQKGCARIILNPYYWNQDLKLLKGLWNEDRNWEFENLGRGRYS